MIPAGREVKHACGQWDWLATFADAAGLPAPAASDGVSLMAALTGRGEQRPGTVYLEYFQPGVTPDFADFAPTHRGRKRAQMQNIYLNGYMGVRYNVRSADDDFEIYNLANDLQEAHNLGKNPDMAALQRAMKARVLEVRVPNSSAPRPYDNAPVPAVAKTPGGAPGLSWSLFEGEWPWLPDFRILKAAKRGQSKSIDLSMAGAGRPFGIAFEGFFYAAKADEYTFTLSNGGGAMLFLHDVRVIGEPIKNSAGQFSGKVRLSAGWHPFRLYYRQPASGKPQLELTCHQGAAGEYKLTPEVFRPNA